MRDSRIVNVNGEGTKYWNFDPTLTASNSITFDTHSA